MIGDRKAIAPQDHQRKGKFTMLRASLIGLATAAALVTGASTASAGDFNISVGLGTGFYPGYVYSPYQPTFYEDDCHYVKTKKWVQTKNGNMKKIWVKKLVCY
jgi:hypothetical protein